MTARGGRRQRLWSIPFPAACRRPAKRSWRSIQDLKAEAIDLDQTEAVSKIEIEAQSKNKINADILQCKDGNGEIYYDFYRSATLRRIIPRISVNTSSNKETS